MGREQNALTSSSAWMAMVRADKSTNQLPAVYATTFLPATSCQATGSTDVWAERGRTRRHGKSVSHLPASKRYARQLTDGVNACLSRVNPGGLVPTNLPPRTNLITSLSAAPPFSPPEFSGEISPSAADRLPRWFVAPPPFPASELRPRAVNAYRCVRCLAGDLDSNMPAIPVFPSRKSDKSDRVSNTEWEAESCLVEENIAFWLAL